MRFLPENQPESGQTAACVEVMPTEALTFGNLDDPSSSDISRLLRQKHLSLQAGAGHKTEGLPRSL